VKVSGVTRKGVRLADIDDAMRGRQTS
jgi:hypothetical protein